MVREAQDDEAAALRLKSGAAMGGMGNGSLAGSDDGSNGSLASPTSTAAETNPGASPSKIEATDATLAGGVAADGSAADGFEAASVKVESNGSVAGSVEPPRPPKTVPTDLQAEGVLRIMLSTPPYSQGDKVRRRLDHQNSMGETCLQVVSPPSSCE